MSLDTYLVLNTTTMTTMIILLYLAYKLGKYK